MKHIRKITCLMAALALLLCLAACGGEQVAPGYRVTVVDALGTPYTEGVVVQFLQNGASVGMQVVGADGVAAKDLPDGEYTVDLSFTAGDTQYHYDVSGVTLTAANKVATVELAKLPDTANPTALSVGGADKTAYAVSTGCTYVTLDKSGRTYFLFTPAIAGTYEFSLADSDATLGYYGAPHYVQAEHAGRERTDGKFTESIRASMIGAGETGTTVMVLGIDAGASGSDHAVLAIRRTGEPEWDPEDEPWVTYQKTVALSQYTLPAGATLKDFDLTADSYTLVLDDKGSYHLNTADGPLVLMRLGTPSQYMDDFNTIAHKGQICKYFYDEKGEFVRKETYNECLNAYIEVMDEKSGVYPLTEDLKYIIQQRGDHYGWFDTTSPGYLFEDQNGVAIPGINPAVSWLFPCCYIG